MSISVPSCTYPGSCTYWVVAADVSQLRDKAGNYCFTTMPGASEPSFNPGCANIGFPELIERCDGFNASFSGGCFDYYSNVMQIFPNGVSDTLSVDSLMNMFALGMHGGFLTHLPLFAMACTTLIVIHLFNYAISKI